MLCNGSKDNEITTFCHVIHTKFPPIIVKDKSESKIATTVSCPAPVRLGSANNSSRESLLFQIRQSHTTDISSFPSDDDARC